MHIKSMELKNFTVFDNFQLEVSPGINIFVGENGTGKTHLLKALYAACELSKNENANYDLLQCFRENQQDANLLRDKNIEQLTISITADEVNHKQVRGSELITPALEDLKRFNPNATPINSSSYHLEIPYNKKFSAVYIPVKDMLTHSVRFLAMAIKYSDFPFDKTLTDIIVKAQRKIKQPPKLSLAISPLLEEMMDGTVVFDNDEFYIRKRNGRLIRFELEAEGLKKIGLLWQLIMTDTLTENSILIWDEPESNLNPKFLPHIVECLLELSRHGVQIFLSTHNYIFAKYFNVRAKDSDSVMFHALYLENGNVQVESNRIFSSLKNNAIMQTFNQLLEEVYNLDMGD